MFECILCNSPEFEIKNNTIRNNIDNLYKIYKCLNCSHIQLYPNNYDYQEYYDNDSQVKEILLIGKKTISHYNEMLENECQKRINVLEKLKCIKKNSNFIDIGGGTVDFVKLLSDKYHDIHLSILEPSVSRINNVKVENNITKINHFLDEKYAEENKECFDVVTSFHVIEHVLDPTSFVKNCYMLLKPGGILCIEMPNQNNHLIELSEYYKNNVWYCKSHISYFNVETFKMILSKLNIVNYEFYANQRYDYNNFLHWVKHDKPQDIPSCYKGYPSSQEEAVWIHKLEKDMSTDSFFVVITK
jgi:2-polyprenyl-3-methyl-5-hydroxy-6-metoxy-1,4-benzoquinol methylase